VSFSDERRILCPRCNGALPYRGRAKDLEIYHCRRDGRMVVGPDGHVRPAEGEERFYVVRPRDATDAPDRGHILAWKKPLCEHWGPAMELLSVGHWANVYECSACGGRRTQAR
jgi:hypothetical protein